MQEMDKLKRARMYMEKLAEGIDPITDMELPSDSVLNNVRLSRCFTYVAGVLGRLVDAGGYEALAQAQNALSQNEATDLRVSFHVTKEQAASVGVEEQPVEMSALCRKLNALIDERQMKKLTVVKITNWLVRKGYLQDQYDEDTRKRVRFPTERGKAVGISFQTYYTYKMKYNATAQRFVLDHMEEITRPTEYTWDWGSWQARRDSSPWTSGLQSSTRSYAEAAWKESTRDESRAGDGVTHTALQIPHTEYPKSKAEGDAPVGGYTDTAAVQPFAVTHDRRTQGAATTPASTGEANGGEDTSREKLWQAAHSVLD